MTGPLPAPVFLPCLASRPMRGGGMTKWRGRAASRAPLMGGLFASISPAALARGAVLPLSALVVIVGGGPAWATCVETSPGSGVYSCSDTETSTRSLFGSPLNVELDDTFSILTGGGDALFLEGAGGLTLTQAAGGGAITGAGSGVAALNYVSGALIITTTGVVTGETQNGIYAFNSADGTNLTIQVLGNVVGGGSGIYAENEGAGALSITAAENVSGGTGDGIYARNVGTDLTIEAQGDVMGGASGIFAENYGIGALTITAAGNVGAGTGNGIYARNDGTDLTIEAQGDVTGGGDSVIYAQNHGTGALTIIAAGNLTGTSWDGINASNGPNGTDLTIHAQGDVAGSGDNGIVADNYGSGALTITTEGAVTGPNRIGIDAFNDGTDLTIDSQGDVTGGLIGIIAENYGSGALTITTTGIVTGGTGDGIYANNEGTDLTIHAQGNVTGGNSGIAGLNYGSGALTITGEGAVTGTNGNGIYAFNSADGTDLTIGAQGEVTGGASGIVAEHSGSGVLSITASGNVGGNTEYGILARTSVGDAVVDIAGQVSGPIAIDMTGVAGTATLKLRNGWGLTGQAFATTGLDDRLLLGGAEDAEFDLAQLGDALNANAILDFDHLVKEDGSIWTLTNANQPVLQSATVNAGVLLLDNATLTAPEISVAAGGGLAGIGTLVGATTIKSGGTIAPGNNGIGTLVVDGDITFDAGSIYEVDVDPAGTASDLIDVSGTAFLNGGSVIHVGANGAYDIASTYTILTADVGVDGEFAGVTSNFAFLDPTLGYDANNVTLTLMRNDVEFCIVGMTRNQCATGDAIDGLATGNDLYDAVVGLDEATARAAFDQLSGEIHASAKGVLIEGSRHVREAVNDRIRAAFKSVGAGSAAVLAYGPESRSLAPATTGHAAAWGHVFGAWGEIDGDGNAAAIESSTGGLLVGGDARVGDWRLGLLAGYSRSSFDVDERASSGSSDNYHLGLYGGTQWNKLAFRSGLAYTWHDLETARRVEFGGFSDRLDADYDAGTFQAFGELGYRVDTEAASFEPFASLAYVGLHTDGFTEQGGAAALSVESDDSNATLTTFGLRASTGFAIGAIEARARAMLGWQHAFGDLTPLSTNAFAGSDAFTIAGAPIAEDSALVEAGLDLDLTATATLAVSYNGQFASRAHDHSLKAQLGVRF